MFIDMTTPRIKKAAADIRFYANLDPRIWGDEDATYACMADYTKANDELEAALKAEGLDPHRHSEAALNGWPIYPN